MLSLLRNLVRVVKIAKAIHNHRKHDIRHHWKELAGHFLLLSSSVAHLLEYSHVEGVAGVAGVIFILHHIFFTEA